jgi:hypothetical protein
VTWRGKVKGHEVRIYDEVVGKVFLYATNQLMVIGFGEAF